MYCTNSLRNISVSTFEFKKLRNGTSKVFYKNVLSFLRYTQNTRVIIINY